MKFQCYEPAVSGMSNKSWNCFLRSKSLFLVNSQAMNLCINLLLNDTFLIIEWYCFLFLFINFFCAKLSSLELFCVHDFRLVFFSFHQKKHGFVIEIWHGKKIIYRKMERALKLFQLQKKGRIDQTSNMHVLGTKKAKEQIGIYKLNI